ncbi:MAG: amidohydrolase [Ilumatobacteraceae bacterium]|nr:amidohydrolase [Ilumatobacteraceae bacterium]
MPLIDVHAHFLPPHYRDALATAGIDQPDGFPRVPTWSADDHVGVMDRLGIDAAVLSVSSPGVRFGDGVSASDAIALARYVNDVAATTIADHPGRFGAFASLPMTDTDESLAEMERALDGLGLDGINVLTNVGGVYLGDASLDPIMAELNRRQALVFIHPTSPACWECTSLGYPRPMIEFPFDTTRAVTNMLLSGVFARYPDIRWIVPHAGGTLPFLAPRIAGISVLLGADDPAAVVSQLRRLYYDLAGSASSAVVTSLLTLVDRHQVLYGSDWPFTPEPIVAGALGWITGTDNPVSAAELMANAAPLFPRFE